MAVLLQSLCVRLGVVTGKDLAQLCRDSYHPAISFILWVLCEIAITACDLAELLGGRPPSTYFSVCRFYGGMYHDDRCFRLIIATR